MENKQQLSCIAHHLMVNASFMNSLGLFYGKMGIVIFFAHYARFTENPLYDKFAFKLLNEIYAEISLSLPIDFANGFCGIGWGIEYLLQEHFMTGDANEILSELDTKIMECDVRRIQDKSLDTGLAGIWLYVHSRLAHGGNSAFLDTYIKDISKAITSLDRKDIIFDITKQFTKREQPLYNMPLCLVDGCAGLGLKLMDNK